MPTASPDITPHVSPSPPSAPEQWSVEKATEPTEDISATPSPTPEPPLPTNAIPPVPFWDGALILVNPANPIPEDFAVSTTPFAGGTVDQRIAAICEAMFRDAKEAGIHLQLVDAYRSHESQNRLYWRKVDSFLSQGYAQEDAEVTAATRTARAGTSEHQTGLALDIVSSTHTTRNAAFGDTHAFRWLDGNAHKYGFILRYPKGKTAITGIIYEPWHWRFVGATAAKEIWEQGICLEEYC